MVKFLTVPAARQQAVLHAAEKSERCRMGGWQRWASHGAALFTAEHRTPRRGPQWLPGNTPLCRPSPARRRCRGRPALPQCETPGQAVNPAAAPPAPPRSPARRGCGRRRRSAGPGCPGRARPPHCKGSAATSWAAPRRAPPRGDRPSILPSPQHPPVVPASFRRACILPPRLHPPAAPAPHPPRCIRILPPRTRRPTPAPTPPPPKKITSFPSGKFLAEQPHPEEPHLPLSKPPSPTVPPRRHWEILVLLRDFVFHVNKV